MNREEYLSNNEVKKFVEWLSEMVCGEDNFSHSYATAQMQLELQFHLESVRKLYVGQRQFRKQSSETRQHPMQHSCSRDRKR